MAHRGASSEAPENTLAAFAKAIEVGADMIEFDVRRASRRQAGNFPRSDPRAWRCDLPTLEETLRLTQGRIQLDVELKEPGCERDAIDLLAPLFSPERFLYHVVPCRLLFAKLAPSIRAFEPA